MTVILESVAATGYWPADRKEYVLREIIGSGATAVVYKAICKTRMEICAIKCIRIATKARKMYALEEIEVMKACNHENIIKYYTSFAVNSEIWIVMRLANGCSLYDIIKYNHSKKKYAQGVFAEETIAIILKEVLKGLEYLHSYNIIHRDIKDENILFDFDGSVQIADFGLSTWISSERNQSLSLPKSLCRLVGTIYWMAPEVMQKNGYDFKADIWCFGILALVMVTGKVPYHGLSLSEIIRLSKENDPPSIDNVRKGRKKYHNYGKSIRKVIEDCLQKDPTKRPTASDLLKYPFFKIENDIKLVVQSLLMDPLYFMMETQTFEKFKLNSL